MVLKLKNLFGGNAQEPAKEVQVLSPREQALLVRFSKAVFTQACCTRPYEVAPGNTSLSGPLTEWHEARVEADGSWAVWRRFLYTPETGRKVETQELFKEGLDFFDALRSLCRYEETQAELGNVLVQVDGNSFSSHAHFRAAALCEGIIFDTQGNPRPTDRYGHILGSFEFDPEEARKALEAARERQKTIDRVPEEEKFCVDLNGISVSLNHPIAEAALVLDSLRDFFVKEMHGNRDLYTHTIMDNGSIIREIKKRTDQMLLIIEKMKAEPVLQKEFLRALQLTRLYMYLYYAVTVFQSKELYVKKYSGGLSAWQEDKERILVYLTKSMEDRGWKIDTSTALFEKWLVKERDYKTILDNIINWAYDVLGEFPQLKSPSPIASIRAVPAEDMRPDA